MTSTKRLIASIAFGLTVVSLLDAPAAWGQRSRYRYQPVPLRLTRISGRLETGVRWESEQRSRQSQAASWASDELEFDEILRIDLAGYSYHPRFLKYQIGLETQALQRPINRSKQANVGGGERMLYGGDWRLTFLEEHPYNLSLYGNIIERDVERSFSRTFRLRSRLYGATGRVRQGPIPLSLTYQHWTRKQSDIGAGVDEKGDDIIARGEYQIGKDSRGSIEYSYRAEDAAENALHLERQELSANNISTFSTDNRKRFFGTLRLYQQNNDTRNGSPQGDFETRQGFLFGNLEWGHTDSLSSFYHTDLQLTDTGGQEATIWNATAGLRHSLYDSLTSELGTYVGVEDASSGYTGKYGTRLTESYTKALSDWGRLSIHLGAFAEFQQQDPEDITGAIFDEPITLGTSPVELDRPDVVPGGVVVTNQSGSITYEENVDYILTTRGRTTEIHRLATGAIQNGETVLVDYTFVLPSKSDILSSGINQSTSLSLGKYFTIYVRSTNNGQQLLHGNPRSRLESYDRYAVGARHNWKLLTTGVEYEKVRSSSVSYESIYDIVSLSTPQRYPVRGHLSGSYRFQDFKETNETVGRISVITGMSMRAWQRGLFELDGEYQRDRWTGRIDDNDLDALGGRARLTLFYRDLEFLFEARSSRIDERGEQEDRDRVIMRVTRRF